ncbi:hypothetical protein JL720_5456 [Aureococcus anophagefferens]|nr:hypothetical protein JL720_5456 [Aureococcus anophagefferens]
MQVNPAIEGLCDDLRDLAVGFHIEDGVLVDVVAAVADLKHHLENFGQPPRLHVTPSCRVLSETAANAEPQPARDDDDDDDDAAESAPKRPRSEGAGVATNMNTWLAKAQQPDGAPRPSPPAAVQRRAPVAQTTVQITFTLDFDAFLGEENYPKDPAAFKAKVVQWFERRVGLTGEAVGKFLTQEKPTKVVIVAPGTKLAVYDPRGCVLVPQLVATATRKVVVPVFMGDIQERDRERLAYLDQHGRIVADDLAKTFGGFLSGDASAKADLSFNIVQSYEPFLDVISEDLNATFGTTFVVYQESHTALSVKQPFEAVSYNRTGNRALARAVLRTCFPTCCPKLAALQAIADSSP